MDDIFTLAPVEECANNAFGSLLMCNSKTTAPIDLICLHNEFYTRDSVLLENLLKDSSPSGDRTKYAVKMRHDVKRALR